MNFQKTETGPGKVEVFTEVGGERYSRVRAEERTGVRGIWSVELYSGALCAWQRLGTIAVCPDDVEAVVERLERLQAAIDAM